MQQSFEKGIRLGWWLLLAFTVALVLLIRIRLLDIPLERDEGEYAYAGQLLLQGVPPYQAAYNLKFPGTYFAYALAMGAFGQTIRGIHLALLLVNAASILLVFLVGRRLMSVPAGSSAAATYAMLAVNPGVLGFAAHATHFVVLPVLAGLWILVRKQSPGISAVFVAGMLFGVAILMKQPAAVFVAFGAISLAYRDWQVGLRVAQVSSRAALFLAAAALPTLLMCVLMWRLGVFEKFWFWTVTYAREYTQLVSLRQARDVFSTSTSRVLRAAWPLWALAALGIVACVGQRKERCTAVVLVAFVAAAAIAVSVGFYFRPHYFVLALPAVALCAGGAVHWAESRQALLRGAALICVACCVAFALFADRAFFFRLDPVTACRVVYPSNPFPETIAIGEFLRLRSTPRDTIAVLGSEPQVAFYAQRCSATGYLYTYGLMEAQPYALAMQREMIREIEAAQPRFLVFVGVAASWNVLARSPRLVFDWMNGYTAARYEVCGLVEMVSGQESKYHLPAPRGIVASSRDFIAVYERKPTAAER